MTRWKLGIVGENVLLKNTLRDGIGTEQEIPGDSLCITVKELSRSGVRLELSVRQGADLVGSLELPAVLGVDDTMTVHALKVFVPAKVETCRC